MIILSSCYIYTNTILYTVEIHSPVCPVSRTRPLPPHPLYIHDQKHDPLRTSQFRITWWEVKTPGQYYIIWIIKYPFTLHPRQKLERHSYNQPTSVQPSFNVFLKTILTQFSFIIVSLSWRQQQQRWMRGRGHMEASGDWLVGRGETSTAELQRWVRKSTGMNYSCAARYDTVRAAVVCLQSAAPRKEGTEHFSWFMWWSTRVHI